jgi:hypothetical protein
LEVVLPGVRWSLRGGEAEQTALRREHPVCDQKLDVVCRGLVQRDSECTVDRVEQVEDVVREERRAPDVSVAASLVASIHQDRISQLPDVV